MASKKVSSAMAKLLGETQGVIPLDDADVDIAFTHNKQVSESKQDKKMAATKTKVSSPPTTQTTPLSVVSLDPNILRPWQFSDRPEDEMGDLDALAKSIQEHGQQEPILVRPLIHAQTTHEYEVIFGNRRWQACKKVNCQVLAFVKTMSDQEAARFQKEENENRKDLSDYARARSYRNQIQSGVFKSERELSRILGISHQVLNDIMAYTRIPDELLNQIPNIKAISRKTAVKIATLSKDKQQYKILKTLANKIGNGEITAANIDSVVASQGHKKTKSSHEFAHKPNWHPVKNDNNQLLFTIKFSPHGDWTIKVPKSMHTHLSEKTFVKTLQKTLDALIEPSSEQKE